MHRWDVSPKRAVAIQQELKSRVRLRRLGAVSRVVGLDCAFSRTHVYAVAVVWDVAQASAIEARGARRLLQFPYIPGLLSFREIPALQAVLGRIRSDYDVLLCDGQGIAHPRRFGLACHLGVLRDVPTIGCAKSRLVGDFEQPGDKRGCQTALTFQGQRVGTVLRTRDAVKPVFVSPGHLVDHTSAVEVVLRCGGGLRLPEPVRLADRMVSEMKRSGRSPMHQLRSLAK